MIFKSIIFPHSKNNTLRKLDGKKIYFCNKDIYTKKIANIVILIGDNGSGKTTLLKFLYLNYLWWSNSQNFNDLSYYVKVTPFNDIFAFPHNYDVYSLYVDLSMNKKNYLCEFFLKPIENYNVKNGEMTDSWLNFDFSNFIFEKMTIKEVNSNGVMSNMFILGDFLKKIGFDKEKGRVLFFNSPSYYLKPKSIISPRFTTNNIGRSYKCFDENFDELMNLHNVKIRIEEKYFKQHMEVVQKIEDGNKFLDDKDKRSVNALKTNFKKLISELYKYTGLNIIFDEKNKKLVVKKGNENFGCDFEKLSSGQKKILLIYFAIIEIKLFDYKSLLLIIDEIENSFSPNQQEKITNFLKDLSDILDDSSIEHQFFIATHSPFAIKNFLNDKRDKVVILNMAKNSDTIEDEKKTKNILLKNDSNNLSYDEVSYLYYDIPTFSYYAYLYETIKQNFEEIWRKINGLISRLNKQIIFNLFKLWDNSCINWESFVKKFDDDNWKNSHLETMNKLTNLLNCNITSLNAKKIKELDQKIKDEVCSLIKNQRNLSSEFKQVENQSQKNKMKLIPFYFAQLGEENYTDWDNFVGKFDDNEWKGNEKNKPIIDELALVLNCPSEQINSEKINGLEEEIKEKAKNLLNHQQNLQKLFERIKDLDNNGFKKLACCIHDWWNSKIPKLNYDIDCFLLENKLCSLIQDQLEYEALYVVGCVKSYQVMKDQRRTKILIEKITISTNLTRLRHMLAHNGKTREWNYEIYKDECNREKFVNFSKHNNDKTKYFYESYEKNPEQLLKKQIETIRTIIIHWEQITNILNKLFVF